jgi:hypothetical protein
MSWTPPWFDSLQAELAASEDLQFSAIAQENRAPFTALTEEAWARFPYGDSFQQDGADRLRRATPLFYGFERTPRLSDRTQAAVLYADPDVEARVFLGLGVGFPPPLWPSSEPNLAAMRRAFGGYLRADAVSAQRFSRIVRVAKGSFEDLGIEDIDQLFSIVQGTEWWLDSRAAWKNAMLDDPWPQDLSGASMIDLRVIAERSAETRDDRRPSVAMRTVWSRSVLVLEASRYGGVVIELRYEPAMHEPVVSGVDLPEDLPADLYASLLRGPMLTESRLDATLGERVSQDGLISLCELRSAEMATFEKLREVAAGGGEFSFLAVDLARDEGARGVLYELSCEDVSPELAAKLLDVTRIGPRKPAPDDDDDDDGDLGDGELADEESES